MDKISKGKSNFETVLASQNCVFGKDGLSFNPRSKKKAVTSFFEKQAIEKSKQSVVSCFYCMKRGHSVRFCRVRKFYVPKGILKWVPKNSKDPNPSVNTHGPTFVREPNLAS